LGRGHYQASRMADHALMSIARDQKGGPRPRPSPDRFPPPGHEVKTIGRSAHAGRSPGPLRCSRGRSRPSSPARQWGTAQIDATICSRGMATIRDKKGRRRFEARTPTALAPSPPDRRTAIADFP
jgi:hypothetical protein